jgi:acyl dehydratase
VFFVVQVERIFTRDEVTFFGNLVGDKNPLHNCMTLQEATELFPTLTQAGLIRPSCNHSTEALVHGMLVSSLFSCIFGTLIPGAIYRSQTLQFRAPIYANDFVVGRIMVTKVKETRGLLVTCDTTVLCQERICVSGEATVWLPGATKAVKE